MASKLQIVLAMKILYMCLLFSLSFVYSNFNHLNIVKVLGVCLDNDPIYIIMELMPGGDLLKFLREAKRDHVSYLLYMYIMSFSYIAFISCTCRQITALHILVMHNYSVKCHFIGKIHVYFLVLWPTCTCSLL